MKSLHLSTHLAKHPRGASIILALKKDTVSPREIDQANVETQIGIATCLKNNPKLERFQGVKHTRYVST